MLDGRNRLDAAEAVGLRVTINDDAVISIEGNGCTHYLCRAKASGRAIAVPWINPYEYVLSANVASATSHQLSKSRDLIAKLIKAQPEKSNRAIAKKTKADRQNRWCCA